MNDRTTKTLEDTVEGQSLDDTLPLDELFPIDDKRTRLAGQRQLELARSQVDAQCLGRVQEVLDALESAITMVEDELAVETDLPGPPPLGTRSSGQGLSLSVVMPVYNEDATLRQIVQRVLDAPLEKELVIVDDASTDGTRAILADLELTPGIRVFYHEKNQGKGAALRTGFAQAAGDVILVQDADLEYDPADYPALLAPIFADRADAVYGSRFLQPSENGRENGCRSSRIHRFGNRMLTAASNLLTRQKLTDMETCYKVFRRDLIQAIPIKQNRFGFEPEITAKLARRKCRIVEVPVTYAPRSFREGKKIGMKDAANAFWCIVRYAAAD